MYQKKQGMFFTYGRMEVVFFAALLLLLLHSTLVAPVPGTQLHRVCTLTCFQFWTKRRTTSGRSLLSHKPLYWLHPNEHYRTNIAQMLLQ